MTAQPSRLRRKPITVGADGSESALRAVRWAAREAALRRCALRIINSYVWPVGGYPEGLVAATELRAALRATSARVLRQARAAAEEVASAIEVSAVSQIGTAPQVLRENSRDSDLVVVGSRGLGGFTGLLLGSTAVSLTSRSGCPVTVVRGERAPTTGPVVVGAGGTPVSEPAVAFAFAEASLRRAPLVAVHAWQETAFDVALNTNFAVESWQLASEQASELVSERLAGWREKYPDVVVSTEVRGIGPAKLLVRHSAGAQLIVVGSRGRGGFAGLTLGSTSQAVLRHANAPVTVVRADT